MSTSFAEATVTQVILHHVVADSMIYLCKTFDEAGKVCGYLSSHPSPPHSCCCFDLKLTLKLVWLVKFTHFSKQLGPITSFWGKPLVWSQNSSEPFILYRPFVLLNISMQLTKTNCLYFERMNLIMYFQSWHVAQLT